MMTCTGLRWEVVSSLVVVDLSSVGYWRAILFWPVFSLENKGIQTEFYPVDIIILYCLENKILSVRNSNVPEKKNFGTFGASWIWS